MRAIHESSSSTVCSAACTALRKSGLSSNYQTTRHMYVRTLRLYRVGQINEHRAVLTWFLPRTYRGLFVTSTFHFYNRHLLYNSDLCDILFGGVAFGNEVMNVRWWMRTPALVRSDQRGRGIWRTYSWHKAGSVQEERNQSSGCGQPHCRWADSQSSILGLGFRI